MNLELEGRVVAITGGSAGIGFACALEFAREGCRVAVCGRNEKRLQQAADRFASEGLDLMTMAVDVKRQADIDAFGKAVFDRFGRLDVWVNCAGDTARKPLWEMTEDEYDHVMDCNVKSTFLGGNCAARYMKSQKSGVIVNISSSSAYVGNAGRSIYGTSKAAVSHLTRMQAGELAAWNIRVVAIEPGTTRTELASGVIPNEPQKLAHMLSPVLLRRVAEPVDIAKPVVFAASDACRFMTGVSILVNGGRNIVNNPDWSYEQFAKEESE